MKVEYKVTHLFGLCMLVQYEEYIKGDNDNEYLSLEAAINAYIVLMNLDYQFDFDEYSKISKHLKKGSLLYFHPLIRQYPDRRDLLITIAYNNEFFFIRNADEEENVYTF